MTESIERMKLEISKLYREDIPDIVLTAAKNLGHIKGDFKDSGFCPYSYLDQIDARCNFAHNIENDLSDFSPELVSLRISRSVNNHLQILRNKHPNIDNVTLLKMAYQLAQGIITLGDFTTQEPLVYHCDFTDDGKFAPDTEVSSTNVSTVGYEEGKLKIYFDNGWGYEYDVGFEFFERMMSASSKGKFVWEALRGKTPGRVIDNPNKWTPGGVGGSIVPYFKVKGAKMSKAAMRTSIEGFLKGLKKGDITIGDQPIAKIGKPVLKKYKNFLKVEAPKGLIRFRAFGRKIKRTFQEKKKKQREFDTQEKAESQRREDEKDIIERIKKLQIQIKMAKQLKFDNSIIDTIRRQIISLRKLIDQDFTDLDYKGGVYIAVKLHHDSEKYIKEYQEKYLNDYKFNKKLHSTLIYSKKPHKGSIETEKYNTMVKFDKFVLFGEEKDTLVMKLKSTILTKRNSELTKKYGFVSDYDPYEPHITLVYGIGKDFNLKSIPKPEFDIVLQDEFVEPLDEEWIKNSKSEDFIISDYIDDMQYFSGPITRKGNFEYGNNVKIKDFANLVEVFGGVSHLPAFDSHNENQMIGFAYDFRPNIETGQIIAQGYAFDDIENISDLKIDDTMEFPVSIRFIDSNAGTDDSNQNITDLIHLAISTNRTDEDRCSAGGGMSCYVKFHTQDFNDDEIPPKPDGKSKDVINMSEDEKKDEKKDKEEVKKDEDKKDDKKDDFVQISQSELDSLKTSNSEMKTELKSQAARFDKQDDFIAKMVKREEKKIEVETATMLNDFTEEINEKIYKLSEDFVKSHGSHEQLTFLKDALVEVKVSPETGNQINDFQILKKMKDDMSSQKAKDDAKLKSWGV